MTLRMLVAPNAFKETLSPLEAAEAIQSGFADAGSPAVTTLLPVSDGGDGLIEVLASVLRGEVRTERVSGPMGGAVTARWAFLADRTAVIEMAEAAGLALVSEAGRDPLRATTRGVGELLRAAAEAGAAHAVLGVGGSATVDGGAGLAQELGVRLQDKDGKEIGPGGGELARLERIDSNDLDAQVKGLEVNVACDVSNPLLGERGAARIFGPWRISPISLRATSAGRCGTSRERVRPAGSARGSRPFSARGSGPGRRSFWIFSTSRHTS